MKLRLGVLKFKAAFLFVTFLCQDCLNALGLLLRLDIRGHQDVVTSRLAAMKTCLLDEVGPQFCSRESNLVYAAFICPYKIEVTHCSCNGSVIREYRQADPTQRKPCA